MDAVIMLAIYVGALILAFCVTTWILERRDRRREEATQRRYERAFQALEANYRQRTGETDDL